MIKKLALLSLVCAPSFAGQKAIPVIRPSTSSSSIRPVNAPKINVPKVYTVANFVIRSSI